jgi:hypothetical protein
LASQEDARRKQAHQAPQERLPVSPALVPWSPDELLREPPALPKRELPALPQELRREARQLPDARQEQQQERRLNWPAH